MCAPAQVARVVCRNPSAGSAFSKALVAVSVSAGSSHPGRRSRRCGRLPAARDGLLSSMIVTLWETWLGGRRRWERRERRYTPRYTTATGSCVLPSTRPISMRKFDTTVEKPRATRLIDAACRLAARLHALVSSQVCHGTSRRNRLRPSKNWRGDFHTLHLSRAAQVQTTTSGALSTPRTRLRLQLIIARTHHFYPHRPRNRSFIFLRCRSFSRCSFRRETRPAAVTATR